MSFPVLLQFARCRTFNQYLLDKCIRQLKPRLYSNSNDDTYNKKQELKNQRHARRREIKARFIQNVQQTKLRVEEIKKNVQQTRQKVEEIIERENIYTIPNFLCIGRILSTPFLGYLIVSQDYEVKNHENIFFCYIFQLPKGILLIGGTVSTWHSWVH